MVKSIGQVPALVIAVVTMVHVDVFVPGVLIKTIGAVVPAADTVSMVDVPFLVVLPVLCSSKRGRVRNQCK